MRHEPGKNAADLRLKTREPQYQECIDAVALRGLERLGLRTSHDWHADPRRLLFVLSRYKFVAKLLSGRGSVLEVGCGDAFGTRLVQQEVETLTAVDFDEAFVNDVQQRMIDGWRFQVLTHDVLEGPVGGKYEAIYALDVLEHIPPDKEHLFLRNTFAPLLPHGVGIIGMPSVESQPYASPASRSGHVNCKSMPDLQNVLRTHFHNVFMFSMNDEVVHTGFHPMAHYLFAVCTERR
jgi:2-polyprenyl-3-methyl-5-hydroxy-6-metoxy-1,4-benzoquinol methylase